MADENKTELTYLSKYQANSLIFTLDDEKIEMDPSNILSIELLQDYDMNYQIITKVQLRMDVRKLLWILENKRDITCKFVLSVVAVDNDSNSLVSNPQYVINDDFNIYFTDEYENIDIDMFKQRLAVNSRTSVNDINDENYFESQNIIDIYLYNKKLIESSSMIYNEIMTEDILQNFVARMLTKTKHEKVLMSKFENNDVYKEIVVPPMAVYRALGYLDTLYGFHKKGTQIFYDYDILYILNTIGECTAKRDKEWTQTTILATSLENSAAGNGMKVIEGDEIYYLQVPIENVGTQKFSNTNNEIMGSEIHEILIDDININYIEADQDYVERRNVYKLQRYKDLNKFAAERLKARMEEADLSLYITGDNYDIRALRPNHEYNVIFDDETRQQKYGNFKYRIAYLFTYIKMSNTDYLDSSHKIILRKAVDKD